MHLLFRRPAALVLASALAAPAPAQEPPSPEPSAPEPASAGAGLASTWEGWAKLANDWPGLACWYEGSP